MSDITTRRVPPGPILDAFREHRWLPDWWTDVPRMALEAALELADLDPRRLHLADDGSIDVRNA